MRNVINEIKFAFLYVYSMHSIVAEKECINYKISRKIEKEKEKFQCFGIKIE